MKLGKINFIILFFLIFSEQQLISEDKIVTSPLINLEDLKPSFEEVESDTFNTDKEIEIKKKTFKNIDQDLFYVKLIGLDKITAKSSELKIKIGETKKFEMLEIKALKCGIDKSANKTDFVAYIQVKDISDSQEEKIFIFNGWTFSANPSLTPIDHAIYDIWLISCDNV